MIASPCGEIHLDDHIFLWSDHGNHYKTEVIFSSSSYCSLLSTSPHSYGLYGIEDYEVLSFIWVLFTFDMHFQITHKWPYQYGIGNMILLKYKLGPLLAFCLKAILGGILVFLLRPMIFIHAEIGTMLSKSTIGLRYQAKIELLF